MARKLEIQLKQWFPTIIESYFIYVSLNTFEVIKHSGGVLRILGQEEHVKEILNVLEFLVKAKFLFPKDGKSVHYFGIDFFSYTYDISDSFKDLIKEGCNKTKQPKSNDWISQIKVENVTHNTVNIVNFNLTFTLEKLIEVKAGLLNL